MISNPGLCFGPKLGYDVPAYISALVGINQQTVDTVEQALLVVLVLHPIAAGFAVVSFICSFFIFSHAFSIFTLFLTILTAILTSIVFAIDVALVATAKNQVKNLQDLHFEVLFGNGVWMILAALIFMWIAVITLSARACYCIGVRKCVIVLSSNFFCLLKDIRV